MFETNVHRPLRTLTEWLRETARFCISDDRGAYVGSANLTRLGLSKHFELGANSASRKLAVAK